MFESDGLQFYVHRIASSAVQVDKTLILNYVLSCQEESGMDVPEVDSRPVERGVDVL